jgi:hypothetical protein
MDSTNNNCLIIAGVSGTGKSTLINEIKINIPNKFNKNDILKINKLFKWINKNTKTYHSDHYLLIQNDFKEDLIIHFDILSTPISKMNLPLKKIRKNFKNIYMIYIDNATEILISRTIYRNKKLYLKSKPMNPIYLYEDMYNDTKKIRKNLIDFLFYLINKINLNNVYILNNDKNEPNFKEVSKVENKWIFPDTN